MIWVDYTVESGYNRFRVKGDWPGEVMGKQKDGSDKGYALYKPGEIYIVGEDGWLRKIDELTTLVLKYENSKTPSTKNLAK